MWALSLRHLGIRFRHICIAFFFLSPQFKLRFLVPLINISTCSGDMLPEIQLLHMGYVIASF